MRVIITRPVDQAASWLQGLRAAGFDAQALPLIEIAAAADTLAFDTMRARMHEFDACMLVSSNAVRYFFKENRPKAQQNRAQAAIKNIAHERSIRYWATGPGTVQALRQAGVDAAQIDAPDEAAQWDSEALWAQVQHQTGAGRRVLIVRGDDMGTAKASRDWLADQIRGRGAKVDIVAAYQRRAPVFSAEQLHFAQSAAQDGSVWVFSSSQAVTHLPQGCNWQHARCVVTHPRVAQAAQAAGFAVVCTSRPALADVVTSIKSMA